jgi:hypothetical protein
MARRFGEAALLSCASERGVGSAFRGHSWSRSAARTMAWAILTLAIATTFWAGGSRAAAANSDLSLVPGNGRITVVWSPPAGVKGTLKASATNGTTNVSCSSTTNSCSLVGVSNGVTYDVTATVTVSSNNVVSTLSEPVTPFTIRGAPSLTSVDLQNARIVASWTAPSSTGVRRSRVTRPPPRAARARSRA